MDKQEGIGNKGFVVRIALALVVAVVSFGLAGCGKQMARIEENQLRLQALVEMNAEQVGEVAQRIEQNQQSLRAAIENVRNSTQQLATDIASVAGEHTRLQEIVQGNNVEMSDKIAVMEQRQQNLQTGIEDLQSGTLALASDIAGLGGNQTKLEDMIAENSRTLVSKVKTLEQYQAKLQSEIKNVQAGAERVASDLAAVADAQAKLEEMSNKDRQRTAGKVAEIEQNQHSQQGEIETLRDKMRKVTVSIGALEENLLRLQEVVQSDTQNLADVIEVIGQGQINFEGKMVRDLRGLADSVGVIQQNQAKLREQGEEIRSSTRAMIRNLTATLDQLKTRVSEVGSVGAAEVAKTEIAASEEVKQQN